MALADGGPQFRCSTVHSSAVQTSAGISTPREMSEVGLDPHVEQEDLELRPDKPELDRQLQLQPEPELELILPQSGGANGDDELPRDILAALALQSRRVERLELQPPPRSILRTPSPATSIGSSESLDSTSGDESKFERPITEEDDDSRFHSCHEEGQFHCLTSCPVGVLCIVLLVGAAITFSLAMADMMVLAGTVEGECVLPRYRYCECYADESTVEPGVISITCIQHYAAGQFEELYPYPGPGSLPPFCNFTRETQHSWVRSAEAESALDGALIACRAKNALEDALPIASSVPEPCWMLPAERGSAWNHCVGKGDSNGPTFASNKAEARSLVSLCSILIFLTLLFLFKCPWTRTRQRALAIQEQTRQKELRRKRRAAERRLAFSRSAATRLQTPTPRASNRSRQISA